MKIDVRLDLFGRQGPDPWDDAWGVQLPLDHIICREADGTPHSIREFIWPWSAYTKDHKKFQLHFFYWNRNTGPARFHEWEVSAEREARIRELQFLMTRQIYFGNENAPRTLEAKLHTLHYLARFAEARSCTIKEVLTQAPLMDACGAVMPAYSARNWLAWIHFLRQLDPVTQLGLTLAKPERWKRLEHLVRDRRNNHQQHAPLPTRIYGELINNLSAELDDIEAHAPRLLAALKNAIQEHADAKAIQGGGGFIVAPALIEKHGLGDYLSRRGYTSRRLSSLSGAVTEIFLVCKLNIHVFSGMRHEEARTLPYHCIVRKKGRHGRLHSLIAGVTTKFNKGRRLRTKWVTTDREGHRAIRLAQRFAAVVYESMGIKPSDADTNKDESPLFPSTAYLPWGTRHQSPGVRIQAADGKANERLRARLFPVMDEADIVELEEIDPFRAWRAEEEFAIGNRWPLTTHQLRRSLAVYANASGLVSLPSLRRQLQHITREMALFYGRGSVFCKDFIANDPDGYKKHLAPEWQDGEDEAMMLAFTRDVLNSKEPMFGGAGTFYQRQKERGAVMSREEVTKRIKGGLLSYQPGPLGGCTKLGGCDKRKGLTLIDISCATDGCMNLVGKHSKVVMVIQLKRAALTNITQGSIEAGIEREEMEALERVEREWRPPATLPAGSMVL